MMNYKSIFQYIAPTFNKKPPFVVPSFHKGGVRGGSCNLTDPQPPNLGGSRTDPQPPNLGGLGGDYLPGTTC